MKKVVIVSCVTALLGGVAGAMVKVNTAQSEIVENVTTVEQAAPVKPPLVPQSKTALLKVLSDKYADKLPKKVSGKVRRKMRKMMAQQAFDPYVRLFAFIKAERAKLGVKK